jgi:hypothetical protein
MPLSQDTLRFIREHRRDDVRSLALQARRYPSVDMPAAITQISGWQVAKEKIPAWAKNDDEMGESTFYDRYYDKVNYMDVNASYTFGKKFKTTFYAEANNLLNQPLRYYQGTKDRTMQAEYYGVKVNAGVKINF